MNPSQVYNNHNIPYIVMKNPYGNLVHYPMDYLPSPLIKCNHCNSNIVDISAALFKLNFTEFYAEGVRDVNNVQITLITSFETWFMIIFDNKWIVFL